MREQDFCLNLLLGWLADLHGRRFTIEVREAPSPNVLAASAADGSFRLAIEVHSALDPVENGTWLAHRDRLQGEMAAELTGAYALWLPPGADLPSGANETQTLIQRVRETALRLEPGQRSHVPLPISIFIKKQQEEGALMSVSGGLNHHWARLTERVRGTYDLDSTHLHRLPESEEHLAQLFELIWERAASLEAVGQWAELETIDAWTIQRLHGDGGATGGLTIMGRPPEELGDIGLSVRRNFRRLLADAGPRLRSREADIKALVVLGSYGRMEEEGATTAMRGYDPSLYAGLEFVCLAADGLIKALMEVPSP
jgi:hypothetical protein